MNRPSATSALHRQRIDAVMAVLHGVGARSVLDLGCGTGDLLVELASKEQFRRIVGVDVSAADIETARRRMAARDPGEGREIEIRCLSLTDLPERFKGFDAAVLLEVIEHIEPAHLHRLERAIFVRPRATTVIVTTPNSEYNHLLGVPEGRFRHPDHRFEWDRHRFKAWATGVAARNGHHFVHHDVPGGHPRMGGPTQMAVFTLPASMGTV